MTTTPLGFAGKMKTMATGADKAGYIGTRDAALKVTTAARVAMPSFLRGVGKRGAKVGARYDTPKKFGGDAHYTAYIHATGPAQLVERDTSPHFISPKAGRKALIIPGVGPRAFAEHPGTSGGHQFERSVMAARGQVADSFHRPYVALMGSIF